MKSKTTFRLVPILCLLVACTEAEKTTHDNAPKTRVSNDIGDPASTAATVNGEIISLEAVEQLIADSPEPLTPKQAADILIRNKLLAAEARRRGFDTAPVVDIVRQDRLATALLKTRVGEGITEENLPEKQLEACFARVKSRYIHPLRRRVVHFLARTDQGGLTDEAALTLARQARAAAVGATDEADFKTRMQPFATTQGDNVRIESLPPFEAADTRLVKPFVDATFALKKPGDISEPVQTSFGQHIIFLAEEEPAQNRSLDEVRQEIAKMCVPGERKKKAAEIVDSLLRQQEIFVYEDALQKGSFPL